MIFLWREKILHVGVWISVWHSRICDVDVCRATRGVHFSVRGGSLLGDIDCSRAGGRVCERGGGVVTS